MVGDHGNNFNLLRLLGAFGVLFFHVYPLLGLPQDPLSRVTIWLNFGMLSVRVFFVISGYLLAESLLRNADLASYTIARALRIWPALVGSTLFCMLVVGPLATHDPSYFARPETWMYLKALTVFEWQGSLPGVFTQNVINVVNGSVWTLPLEVVCYIALGMATPLLFRARWLAAVILVLAYGSLFTGAVSAQPILPGVPLLSMLEYGAFFAAGTVLRLYRIKGHVVLDALALGTLAYIALTSGADWRPIRVAEIVCTPYLVIRAGLAPWRPFAETLNRYDISYGVFLYSFPLTQVVVLALGRDAAPPLVAALAAALTVPLAFLSYVLIEHPALGLKRRLRGDPKLGRVVGKFPQRWILAIKHRTAPDTAPD
jgi:peptidoglycan/LPS O-acetylase OafA/YrhL